MMGNTHFIGGVTAGVILGTVMDASVGSMVLSGLFGGIGGLVPDLDSPKSTICKLSGPIGSLLSRCFKHRGVMHTPLLWIFINALIGVLFREQYQTNLMFQICLMSLFWGEMSHLLLDSLNHAGIMWFWPFSRKRFHIIGCKADGPGNSIAWGVCFVMMVVTVLMYADILKIDLSRFFG